MRILRHPQFLAVSLGHWMVDVLASPAGVLLAVLSAPLGLTNAAIGLIATGSAVLNSATQPLFGWLADRHGPRWITAGGVLWIAAFFALVAVTPGYWPIVFLMVSTLGSAAFHPPGASQATQIGQTRLAGQAATALSLFILFGQSGLSLGPALTGLIIDRLGRPGLLALAVLALPVGLYAAAQLRPHPQSTAAAPAKPKPAARPAPHPADLGTFGLAVLLAGLRTWAQVNVTTFAPKYFHDLGVSATVFGVIVALFMGGSALGGVAGGILSDRWNRRWTVVLSMALSIAPLYLLPGARGGWIFPVAALAGFLNGMPHSVLISMAQRALPGRAALASGVALGLIYTSGTLGAYGSGLAGDHVGLGPVLQANAILAAAVAGLSLLLRPEQRQPVPVPADG